MCAHLALTSDHAQILSLLLLVSDRLIFAGRGNAVDGQSDDPRGLREQARSGVRVGVRNGDCSQR